MLSNFKNKLSKKKSGLRGTEQKKAAAKKGLVYKSKRGLAKKSLNFFFLRFNGRLAYSDGGLAETCSEYLKHQIS